MIAMLKEPGKDPRLVNIENTQNALFQAVGGAYDTVPALLGAMALCRSVDVGLEHNCHFMGRRYCGNLLIVGRGKGNVPTDLPERLRRVLKLAFGEKTKA